MQWRALLKVNRYLPFLLVILVLLLWIGCEEENVPEIDDTVVVMPYNGPHLNASDSWTFDKEKGLINRWQAYLAGDSVVIERAGLCGEYCKDQYQLVLMSWGTALPTFRGCAYLKNYSYPVNRTLTDSLVSGEIEIQDWDPAGIVSGTVNGRWRSGDSLGFVFWANVMAEQVELVMSSYYSYEYPLIDSLDDSSIDELVRAKYHKDSDRMALRIMHNLGVEATAELEIPTELSNTIYQALIHVYVSDDIAARDSVVDLYDIHTWPSPEMNRLMVLADSSTMWMQAWKQGLQSTGHTGIDTLMDMYGLEVGEYISGSHKTSTHMAILLSPRRRNITALADLFQAIEGIDSAVPDDVVGDGPDINVWAGDNSWQVVYSLGWGDCLNGCINRHLWVFTVSYAGDVDHLSSSGPDIPSVLD